MTAQPPTSLEIFEHFAPTFLREPGLLISLGEENSFKNLNVLFTGSSHDMQKEDFSSVIKKK